jgi:2-polyprenyl-3-methyl-5-hydroxy-6-metoxy-1,4-benzoquinol methylase
MANTIWESQGMMLKEIKRAARSTARYLPDEGRALTNAYKQLVVLQRVAATKLGAYSAARGIDPERVYAIDPARILLAKNKAAPRAEHELEQPAFDPRTERGKVYGGDWDRGAQWSDDLPVTTAPHQRVSLATERPKTDDEGHAPDIGVNIDRDGRYLLNDGISGLATAKALRLPHVPVKVRVRHRQWMEFRNFMWSLSEEGGAATRAKHLYQNPVHPDLQDIPAAHSCEDRFEAARSAVPARGGLLLDIGANLGYFSHRFEDLGYTCHAVEYEPLIARAADKIRIAEGKQFKIITGDLFEVAGDEPLRGKHWDVVLAYNIFHHFLKHKALHDKLVAWLKSLSVDVMIFEPHRNAERQMRNAYASYDETGFVDFILSNSVLQHSQLVHRCRDGRPVYKLWR